MKKIFFLVFFAIVFIGKSQSINNRFNEDNATVQHNESSVTQYEENPESIQKVGPGNPNEPVPIDGGIVGLLLVGVTLISYFILKKRINHVK